jgi:release factor glutamine methyltransferase
MAENQEVNWLLREKYKGVKNADFEADSARLAVGEPLGYLIGHVPFLDCTIHLDSHPLIPRVETEFWVEKAITTITSSLRAKRGNPELNDTTLDCFVVPPRKDDGGDTGLKILDLCAGSGAIGVAVAKLVPEAEVTFAEIDQSHLPTIQKNLSQNEPVKPFVRMKGCTILESDLFANVAGRFDFILTNPPYIDAEAQTVDANVAEYEPHLALFGGTLGMEIIARIILGAREHLTPTGQLWIEHEPAQTEAIAALAHDHGFTIVTHPDQYDTPRFSVLSMAQ